MSYKAVAAALVISIVASPAVSKEPTGQKSPKGQASVDDRKYCIKFEFTGSRILREQCRTKKEWADEDIQIDEMKSN